MGSKPLLHQTSGFFAAAQGELAHHRPTGNHFFRLAVEQGDPRAVLGPIQASKSRRHHSTPQLQPGGVSQANLLCIAIPALFAQARQVFRIRGCFQDGQVGGLISNNRTLLPTNETNSPPKAPIPAKAQSRATSSSPPPADWRTSRLRRLKSKWENTCGSCSRI